MSASDLPKIGSPATRALTAADITTVAGAAAYGRAALLELHGVGPRAIRLLEEAMAEQQLAWADE